MLVSTLCPGVAGEGDGFLGQSCAKDFSGYLIALKIVCVKTWNHLVLRRCTLSSVLQLYHTQDLGQSPRCCSGALWLSEVVIREQILVEGMILSCLSFHSWMSPLWNSHTGTITVRLTPCPLLAFPPHGEFRPEFCSDLFFFCRGKITHPTNPTYLVFGSACWEWGFMPGEVHTNTTAVQILQNLPWHGAETNGISSKRMFAAGRQDVFVGQGLSSMW